MVIKFSLYVPKGFEEAEEVLEIKKTLEKVKFFYNLEIINSTMDEKGEEKLKSQILWYLSVFKRIGIKQTKRTKSLYTQLVIFSGNTPITFYPQSYSKSKITILEFLEGLLNGEVKCLHEKFDLEDKINSAKIKIT